MSKNKIISTRVAELTAFLEAGELLTAGKKEEFASKWNVSLRMVERYTKKALDGIAAQKKTEKKSGFNEIEIAAKKLHGNVLTAVSKLCAIANGEYESEKMMYVHNEPKSIKCKPSVKEQLQAMKLLKEYEELFVAIKENQEKAFNKMLEMLQTGKTDSPPYKKR